MPVLACFVTAFMGSLEKGSIVHHLLQWSILTLHSHVRVQVLESRSRNTMAVSLVLRLFFMLLGQFVVHLGAGGLLPKYALGNLTLPNMKSIKSVGINLHIVHA